MNKIAKKMLLEHLGEKHRDRDYGEHEYGDRHAKREYRGERRHREYDRYYRKPYRDRYFYDEDDEYYDGHDHEDEEHSDYHHESSYQKESVLHMKPDDAAEWLSVIENSDGTTGAKFTKDRVKAIAEQEGIVWDKITLDDLYVATNMIYSDYYSVAKKFCVDRPDFYVCFAHSFLCDKDFVGEPSEKLAMYYYCIAAGE